VFCQTYPQIKLDWLAWDQTGIFSAFCFYWAGPQPTRPCHLPCQWPGCKASGVRCYRRQLIKIEMQTNLVTETDEDMRLLVVTLLSSLQLLSVRCISASCAPVFFLPVFLCFFPVLCPPVLFRPGRVRLPPLSSVFFLYVPRVFLFVPV